SVWSQSNCGSDLSSSAPSPILCSVLLGGESERAFFAFFTLVYCKHTHEKFGLKRLSPQVWLDLVSLRSTLQPRLHYRTHPATTVDRHACSAFSDVARTSACRSRPVRSVRD